MSKISYAEVIGIWESLLAAAEDRSTTPGEFEPYATELKRKLEEVVKTKARQISAQALKQQCTQDLREGVGEGNAVAMRLRGLVVAKFGAYDEGLVQFGMTPVRPGRRRRKGNSEAGKEETGQAGGVEGA